MVRVLDVQLLSTASGTLVYQDVSTVPTLQVRQNDQCRWLHAGDSALQSAMYLARPEQLILQYMRAMLTLLAWIPSPKHILNLGLGGGAFNRFFAKFYPNCVLDTVERDSRIAAIAESYFAVDLAGCVIDSAERYLVNAPGSYDLVLIDLYEKPEIAPLFLTADFYSALGRVSDDTASIVINTLPADQTQLFGMLQIARNEFAWTALLDVPQHQNIIVFLSNATIPSRVIKPCVPDLLDTLPELADNVTSLKVVAPRS